MRKSLSSELLYRYGQVRSHFPYLLSKPLGYYFYITGRCNLDCTYCWQRDQDKLEDQSTNSMSDELSPDEWKLIVERLPSCNFLGLSGGEVTLSKALPVIMGVALQRNIPVTINTNGRFLNEACLNLFKNPNLKNISISLDGFADIHDKSRSMAGLFDAVVANIKKLNKLRSDGARFSVTIKTVLLDENVDQLAKFKLFCEKELLADTLNISFMKTGNHAQFSFVYEQDMHSILNKRKTALYSYRDPEQITDVLSNLLSENSHSRCEVEIFPRMSNKRQIKDFLENHGQEVYRPCYLPWAMTILLPNGTVIPCLSVRLGNIKDHGYDMANILKSDFYSEILSKIKKWGTSMPEACHACCFLKVR